MNSLLILVLLGLAASTFAAYNTRQETSGDARNFKADPTLIVNKEPIQDIKNASTTGWVMYKQCDSRWAYDQLGYCGGTSICSAGCAMSSVAMILATKGVNINPGSLNSWLTSNGGYANGCNIYWGSVDAFGVTSFQGMQNANENEICNGLSKGHGIVANVNGGGHWVLLTGCAGGGVFYVNDPGYNKNTYTMGEILSEAVYH